MDGGRQRTQQMNSAGDKATTSSAGGTRSLLRGLSVLEALAFSGGDSGLGITEIATSVGFDKATVARAVNTLCQAGYVYQDTATRRYKLTGRLSLLASKHHDTLDLPQRAAPYLSKLREMSEETVHLGVRQGDRIVYVSKLESPQPVQISSAVGQTMPLHTTALGKAILSSLPLAEREAIVDGLDLVARTPRSLTNRDDLLAEVELSAHRGYSVDDGENEESITCVGAPIVNAVGGVLGAFSIGGPEFRMRKRIDELGTLCREVALQLGGSL